MKAICLFAVILLAGTCTPRHPLLEQLGKSKFLMSLYISSAECQNMYSSSNGGTSEGDKAFADLMKSIPVLSSKPCPRVYEGHKTIGRCIRRGNETADPHSLIERICYLDSCREGCKGEENGAVYVPAHPLDWGMVSLAIFIVTLFASRWIVSRAAKLLPPEEQERISKTAASVGKYSLPGTILLFFLYFLLARYVSPPLVHPGFFAVTLPLYLMSIRVLEHLKVKALNTNSKYLNARLLGMAINAVGWAFLMYGMLDQV